MRSVPVPMEPEWRADLRARHVAMRCELAAIVARADRRRAETAELARETVRLLATANREGARAAQAMQRAIAVYRATNRRQLESALFPAARELPPVVVLDARERRSPRARGRTGRAA